ncbi:MAG: hypothetical protein AAFO59_10485 [Cyanobacteria bacterium J06607_17]
MGLLSRSWGGTQFLAICLGIWIVLDKGAVAQDVVSQNLAGGGLNFVELADKENGLLAAPLFDGDDGCDSAIDVSVSKLVDPLTDRSKCEKARPGENRLMLGHGDRRHVNRVAEAAADQGPGREPDQRDERQTEADDTGGAIDDELGILRVRSQPVGTDSELGTLRIRPTEEVPLEVEPEPTRQTSVFLTGRANVYGGGNLFRTPNPIDDRIYQAGAGIFAFPRLSDNTNLVLSAETNLARYEDLSVVDYNELQFQAGIRQRLGQRSYGQINWRYQDLSTPGSDSFFTANYVELLLSRRDILNNRTWLDTYYQARLSHSDPKAFSRFSQIATGSLNYGFDPQTRVSLLYQLFLDDYTEVVRFDTYHQILAQVSHDLSSTTRISLFTGVRFGDSSLSTINFDDTIYGASINVNWPLF